MIQLGRNRVPSPLLAPQPIGYHAWPSGRNPGSWQRGVKLLIVAG